MSSKYLGILDKNKRGTNAEALRSSRKLQRQFLTFSNGKKIAVPDTNSKDLCSCFDVVEPRADYSQVFLNLAFNKGILKNFVYWCFVNYGQAKTIKILEKLQLIGFSYATKAGISLSIDDLKIPPIKAMLLTDAEKSVEAGLLGYKKAQLTGLERFQRIIETWHKTSESLKDEMIEYFRKTDTLNPVYMMAFSGARGNISQVRQLVSMRGLMSDPQGKILSFPIQSNFREGLTLTEYVISCYGARKGVVDTALRTANAGYLTRRLVDVAQHVIVLNFDCGTKKGFYLTEMTTLNKTLYPLRQRLIGRVLAADVYNLKPTLQNKMSKTTKHNLSQTKNGFQIQTNLTEEQIVGRRNQEISEPLAQKIAKLTNKVFIRSPLTCATPRLVCQLCYGWSLSEGYLVSIGEAVGIIAAQSIGEPGTQLTMRTFHTGGVFSGEMFDQLIAPYDAIITYSAPVPGTLIRTTQGKIAFLIKGEGQLSICKFDDLAGWLGSTKSNQEQKKEKSDFAPPISPSVQLSKRSFNLPPYTVLFVRNNEKVLKDQLIAELAFLSSKIAQKSETAEFIVKSELEGQIYSGSINIVEKYTNYNDMITQSKDWGTVWLLSGKICQLPLNSAFFALPGDLVDETSVLSEVKWFVPVKTLLDTNSVIKPIKKERYYDFSLNKNKWSTLEVKQKKEEGRSAKGASNFSQNLDKLTFLFNLKLQNAGKEGTTSFFLPTFFSSLKKSPKKNQNQKTELYLRSFLGHNIAQFSRLASLTEPQTLTFQKKLINSNNPIKNRSFIGKFKMRLNSGEHQIVKDFSLKLDLSEPAVSNVINEKRELPLIKSNRFNTSSINKSEIENFFSIKNKININLPLILINIDKIYYKNFGYFFSFVQKKLYGDFPDISAFFLQKQPAGPRFFSHEKLNNLKKLISDQQLEKRSFSESSSDVFFVPKLLEQRTTFWQRNYGPSEIAKEEDTHLFSSATPTLNIKYQNRLSKDLFHWFPKRYLTFKGGICIYSFNYDSLPQYSNFLNNLNYLETKNSNYLKSKVKARILWVNNYFSPKKMYTVKIGNKMIVKHTDKSNSSMPKTISKFDFPFIFERKSLFLAGLNIFKEESKALCLKYILDSKKVGKKIFVRNGYTTLKSFCFKQKEINRTAETRKNELCLFSFLAPLKKGGRKEPRTLKPNQRKPQFEVNSNAYKNRIETNLNSKHPAELDPFRSSLQGLDKNVFIYKIKNLVSAISLHKKILFPGQKLVDDLSFDSAVYVTCFPEKNLPHNKKWQKNGSVIKNLFYHSQLTNKAELDQFSVKKIISNKSGFSGFKTISTLIPNFSTSFIKMKQSTFILLIRKIREYPVYQSNYYKKLLYQSHKTKNSLKFNSKVCTKIAKSNYHSELLNKQYPSLRLLEKCAKIDLVLDLSYKGLKQSLIQNLTNNLINFNFYRKSQLLKTFQFGYFPLKKLTFVQNRAALFLLHSRKEKLNVLLQKGQIQFHSENPVFSTIEDLWKVGPQSNVHKSEWYQTAVDSPVTSIRPSQLFFSEATSVKRSSLFFSEAKKKAETKKDETEGFISNFSGSVKQILTEETQTYVSLVFSFFYKRKRTRSCNFVSKGSLNERTKKRRVGPSFKQKQSFHVSSTIFERNSFITSSNIEFLTKSSTQLLTCGLSARQKKLLKPQTTKLFKYNSFQESKLKATFKRNSQLLFKVSPFHLGNSSKQRFENSIDQKSEQGFNAPDSFLSTPSDYKKVVKGIKLKVFNEIKRPSNYSLSITAMRWNESKIALIRSHNNSFKHWKISKEPKRSKFYVWNDQLALVVVSFFFSETEKNCLKLTEKTNNLLKDKDPQGLDNRFFSDIGYPLLNGTSDKNASGLNLGFLFGSSFSSEEKIWEKLQAKLGLSKKSLLNYFKPREPWFKTVRGEDFFSEEKIWEKEWPFIGIFPISSQLDFSTKSLWNRTPEYFDQPSIQEEIGQENNFKGDLRNPENLSNLERAFAASGVNFLENSSWGSSSNGNGTGRENASIQPIFLANAKKGREITDTKQTRSFIFLPFSSLVGSIIGKKKGHSQEDFVQNKVFVTMLDRNRNDFDNQHSPSFPFSHQFTRDVRFLRLFQKKTNQNSFTTASGSGFSLLYQKPPSFTLIENKKNEYYKKHFLNSFSFFNFLDKKIKNFSQLEIFGSRPKQTTLENSNNEVQDWNHFSKKGEGTIATDFVNSQLIGLSVRRSPLFFSEATSVKRSLTETKKAEERMDKVPSFSHTNPNDLYFKNSSFYNTETKVNTYYKKQMLENTFNDLFEQYLPRKKRTTVYNSENLQINPNNMSQISWQPNCYFNYDQKSHFPYFSKSSLINSYFVRTPGSNNMVEQTNNLSPGKLDKVGTGFFCYNLARKKWEKVQAKLGLSKTSQHFDSVSGFGNKNNFKNYSLFSQFLSIFISPNLKGKNLTLQYLTEFVFPSNHDFSLLAGFFHQPCLYAFFSSQVAFGHNELMLENPYLKLSKKGLKTKMAFKSGFCSEQGELVRTSYLSPFKGEILRHETYYWSQNTQRNRYLFLTKNDQISLYSNNYLKQKKNKSPKNAQLDPLFSPLIQKKSVGQFITQGDYLKLNSENVIISSESGILIHYNKFKVTLRKAQSFFLSPNCIFHYAHGDLVEKNKSILSLPYQQLKTGDIVQGIPKVEQLLEARSTFKGKEEEDNLHTLLIYVFELYKKKFSLKLSVRKAFSFIQLILVNSVQRIYRSQGVNISDKHLEVIVKQMTSKVQITSRGDSSFFRGEYVDLYIVETWNSLHPQLRKICYKPILLGISRSSLEVNSFLSAASFQHTKKVLSRSAFKTNIDFLNGLKENVIIGNLISAGTGVLINNTSKQ